MAQDNLRALLEKLNPTCLDALTEGAELCKAAKNYEVDLEHWLYELNKATDGDLPRIYRRFGVDREKVERELRSALNDLRTGNLRTPTIARSIETLIERAWVIATMRYQEPQVRSGVLLLALLGDEALSRLARAMSRTLATIAPETLGQELTRLLVNSPEVVYDMTKSAPPAASASDAPKAGGPGVSGPLPTIARPAPATPGGPATADGEKGGTALEKFTVDLTAQARAGKIDPIRGRDEEIRQMADILIRRRQNNPLLVGEAGVGKTAVVEGFARRVAQGDVPPPLKDVEIRTLDLGLLEAGAGVKGEFENRLKGVIREVGASPRPIILFIDEAHTLIGAGGQAGTGDAANLLKPALARGELRTIAATTWAEYKKYFEKDAALERRFQVVKIEEPSEEKAVMMMRAMAPMLETHHKVRILDEAIVASVRLSARYISGRQLPDKSLSLLDTACARVALGQDAVPPEVEAARRRIEEIENETALLRREGLTGPNHDARIASLDTMLADARSGLETLDAQWSKEKGLVDAIEAARAKLESGPPDGEREALRATLDDSTKALRELQGDSPLMHVWVDAQVVAGVVSAWTGIPVGKMQAEEIRDVLSLVDTLKRRVIGQDPALEAICERIQSARANLTDPGRPVGVFLLVGPSGVGKTETALALADALYGTERSIVSLNMSEYKEAHTVSSLKGSPPGYVGYGEGGVLTEAVRKKPFCVVLLDEVEKAHPEVMELFYQVFDKGVLQDSEGRVVDFKSTIILLTSNLATDLIVDLATDPEKAPGHDALAQAVRHELLKSFKPAFLGRLVIVPYRPLSPEVMAGIARMQLDRIGARVREHHGATFTYDDALVDLLIAHCNDAGSGARNIDQLLNRRLMPDLSRKILARMAEGIPVSTVKVTVDEFGEIVIDVG